MNNISGNEFINKVVKEYSDTIFRIAIQDTQNILDAEV